MPLVPEESDHADGDDRKLREGPWAKVSSPVALRVLKAVYNCVNEDAWAREHMRQARESDDPPAESVFRLRLRRSGIAQGIAAGLDMLPDIYEHLAPPWRGVLLAFRPRKPENLAIHVLDNLNWYLDPASVPRVRTEATLALLCTAIVAAVTFCLLVYALARLGGLYLVLGSSALIVLIYYASPPLLKWLERLSAPSSTSDGEAFEYFLYLLESYSDERADA